METQVVAWIAGTLFFVAIVAFFVARVVLRKRRMELDLGSLSAAWLTDQRGLR